ncbi:MAG: hypothetical protein LBU65_05880 [Planctomycetaceae bacterium]|jgi:hypothetical protein|nr:hypothetical protein [Planctomycetaceae bacterium]
MSDLVKQNIPADAVDDDDNWQPIAIPIEEDTFFTPEDIERLRLKHENRNRSKDITLTFEQLHALTRIFEK